MGKVIQFTKGDYICFRAKRGFHLGEMKTYIKKGEDVWFDGYSADFGDGVKVFYPRLKSAIKAGWLGYTEETPAAEIIMDEETTSPFMMVVDHEERVVGEILDPKKVALDSAAKWFEGREDDAPQPKVQSLVAQHTVHAAAADDVADFFDDNARSPATPAKTASSSSSSPPAFMPVVQDIGSEGVVIGTVGGILETGAPTSMSAEELNEERLIEALGEGSSAVAAAREARLAKNAGKVAAKELAASRRAKRVAALGPLPTEPAAETAASEPEPEPESDESQLMPIGPGITWDLGRHWATRVKDAVTNYAEFPGLLAGILKIESEGVRKAIEKSLAKE